MLRYLIAVSAILIMSLVVLTSHWANGIKANAAQDPTPTPTPEAKPFDREQALAEIRKRIAGSENKPAEEVFKNIQTLKGVPAGRVPAIMAMGYSKSLGVDCTHCHVPGQWEKDELPTKQIAREMSMMMREIGTNYLAKIKGLKSEKPAVNCTTCHRGQTKPALNLP